MPRSHRDAAGFYLVSPRFVDECLRQGGSLFTPGQHVWSSEPIAELYRRFVESPDEGTGDFTTKLLGQLEGAPSMVFQLAAEMLYVLLLPQHTDAEGKRRAVEAVLSASPEPIEIPVDLADAMVGGIASYGAALTQRFNQYVFLCEFARGWAGLGDERRHEFLGDPWTFRRFMGDVPHKGAQSQVEALAHMVFPDVFEPIVSVSHKQQIANAFAEFAADADASLDQRLASIRSALEEERGKDFSYYDDDLAAAWRDVGAGKGHAWLLRGANDRGVNRIPDWLDHGYVSIGWEDARALKVGMTKDELYESIKAAEPGMSDRLARNGAGNMDRFFHRMSVGDYALTVDGRMVFVGRITGEPEEAGANSDADEERSDFGAYWRRSVEWFNASSPIDRGTLPLDLQSSLKTLMTLTEITKHSEDIARLVERAPDRDAAGIHLVVKWTPKFGPDTDVRHIEVAKEHGSVWWGLISKTGEKWISDSRLTQLREQLNAGRDVFVFIVGQFGASTCWRTHLLDFALDQSSVDPELVPAYYSPEWKFHFWVKLSQFDELERDELYRLLDPDTRPGLPVALANQTNPLFVRLRTRRRYWWANQGTSFRRARAERFLWAPLVDKVGQPKDHWQTLRYLRPGDIVFNYANGQIRATSVTLDDAAPTSRPDPEADQASSEVGLRVDLNWRDLVEPVKLVDIPAEWRRDERAFASDGSVNKGYLFPLSDGFVSKLADRFPQLLAGDAPPPTALPKAGWVEPTLNEIAKSVADSGMTIEAKLLRRYHVSLKTRGFVVLSGVSGTGKTWLAQAYADAVQARAIVVPVAPNWTTNEDLLGYLNPLKSQYQDTAFSLFLRDAATEFEDATTDGREPVPYHLILDEMNLARVEYYFAKFLSAMELRVRTTDATIELAPGDLVLLPQNLKFVGTVNVDETTHGFADKVYDRSQLIEMTIDRGAVERHLEGRPFAELVGEIWTALTEVAPFAFRVLDEIMSYVDEASRLAVGWEESLDEQLLQKVLPKIKGTDLRLGAALRAFADLTADSFPLSHAKATTMLAAFNEHGFTSYF